MISHGYILRLYLQGKTYREIAKIVKCSHQNISIRLKKYKKSREEIFWDHIKKTKNCWVWKTFEGTNNRGSFNYKGEIQAHRVAWTIINGKIPKGRLLCHKCDNPPCVRPSHLFIGTHKDNSQDMVKKHRTYSQFDKLLKQRKVPKDLSKNIFGNEVRNI